MAPMEPWQRVWIDAETYSEDLHSAINCTDCHGGQSVDDMQLAHEGLTATPGDDAVATCGNCHPDIAPAAMGSLHTTLAGYDTVLHARSAPEHTETLEVMESYHCNSCHTTCGDCHISQPVSVGGGLLDGHAYAETPPMSRTCSACHGSRVTNEYFGLNEGIPSDVHFRERMACTACHTGDEIHGIGTDADHRYAGEQEPTCESCHEDQIGVGSGIEQHEVHGTELLSCQTCHSTTYTNCINCHVEQTDAQQPFYTVEEHFLDFAIGRNPRQDAERPYRYVPLRHVPIDIDSFSFYGPNLLPNFDLLPTWVYSTPHNIQRITPQNSSCLSCHGNDAVFLTADRVVAEELAANASVIVEAAPPLPEGYSDSSVLPPTAAPTEAPADDGGFWGGDGAAATPTPAGAEDSFWGGGEAATPTPAGDEDAFWGGGDSAATPTSESEQDESEDDDSFWGN